MSKLTLSLEQSLIDRLKRMAQLENKSLSEFVETLLKNLPEQPIEDDATLNKLSIIEELAGSVQLKPEFKDADEGLYKALLEKYLHD